MIKTSAIAFCVLALSSATVLAQSYGPNAAPGGAGETAPRSQALAQDGVPAAITARGTENPRGVAITDEYGIRYNSRGERIGRGPAMR